MQSYGKRYVIVEKFKRSNLGNNDLYNKIDLDKYLSEKSKAMKDGLVEG